MPVLQAQGLRAAGCRVACVGLAGYYDADLPEHCDDFTEVGLARLGQWLRQLRRYGASEAIMVGLVSKSHMLRRARLLHYLPDFRSLKLWFRELRHDRRSQFMLSVIAREMERAGVPLIDTTRYIPDHMAAAGVMTRTRPTASQERDITFAWPILCKLNELDIGQALTVRDLDVIALEAMEGTDRMIQRTGELCQRRGWVLVKGAEREKDLRYDVPTVGVDTIELAQACGAGCIALAAERVIMVQKADVIAAADAAGIALVGVPLAGPGADTDAATDGA